MHITMLKTSNGVREVHMLDEVRQVLLQERRQQFKGGGCKMEIDGYEGFIFTNQNGYVHNHQAINRAIQRIWVAYNEQEAEQARQNHREPLTIRHFSVHNFRHTFCTRFCENETNINAIQEIMGHKHNNECLCRNYRK